MESKYLWDQVVSNWKIKYLYSFAVLQILATSFISNLTNYSCIDTNLHDWYESHRKLTTCVHVIINPKQIVHALRRKMMNVYTVYQWSIYLGFMSCPLAKCWECSIHTYILQCSATSSVCQFLLFSGISHPLCIPPSFYVFVYIQCVEYLTFREAWSHPSYRTVCLHLYSNCFISNCVQDNNIDYLTIQCPCSCATNI